jgi:hypothetical protein
LTFADGRRKRRETHHVTLFCTSGTRPSSPLPSVPPPPSCAPSAIAAASSAVCALRRRGRASIAPRALAPWSGGLDSDRAAAWAVGVVTGWFSFDCLGRWDAWSLVANLAFSQRYRQLRSCPSSLCILPSKGKDPRLMHCFVADKSCGIKPW